MAKSVVVTGVSTGIGRGIAQVLLRKGFRVFGSVRRESDAQRLRAELGPKFTRLLMDVTDESAVMQAAEDVDVSLGRENLMGLVNNAGVSFTGPLLHQPLGDVRRQLEVNLVAPLLVTRAFARLLGTNDAREGGPGRIVNISSVGGRIGPPFLGAYAASKHGVEGMSESLRRELLPYGIDVILIAPGYVNTPILDKADAEDRTSYGGTDYARSLARFSAAFIAEGRRGLSPLRVGEVVHRALTSHRPHVRYVVAQRRFWALTVPSLLPKRVLDRLIGKQAGLLPLKP